MKFNVLERIQLKCCKVVMSLFVRYRRTYILNKLNVFRSESLRNMVKSFFFCVEKVLYTRNSFEELGNSFPF